MLSKLIFVKKYYIIKILAWLKPLNSMRSTWRQETSIFKWMRVVKVIKLAEAPGSTSILVTLNLPKSPEIYRGRLCAAVPRRRSSSRKVTPGSSFVISASSSMESVDANWAKQTSGSISKCPESWWTVAQT